MSALNKKKVTALASNEQQKRPGSPSGMTKSTVESRDYAPPPWCMLALGMQKWGGGLYVGSLHLFCVMTITDCRMPHGRMISALSLAV